MKIRDINEEERKTCKIQNFIGNKILVTETKIIASPLILNTGGNISLNNKILGHMVMRSNQGIFLNYDQIPADLTNQLESIPMLLLK